MNAWIVLMIACLFQGSFGICFKKYKPFSWEAFWAMFSLIGILILPHLTAAAELGDYMKYITGVQPRYLAAGFLCGLFWGISAIWYSRAIEKIGVSLVTGINMGLSNLLGCFVPMFLLQNWPSADALVKIIIGQAIIMAGTVILIKAGNIRNHEMASGTQKEQEERSASGDGEKSGKGGAGGKIFFTGVIMAMASGLGTACLNIGTSAADKPVELAVADGITPAAASILSWIVILAGGFLANFFYACFLLIKNRSYRDYVSPGCGKAYLKVLLTSVVWFLPLALYGRAKIMMDAETASAGWIVFNSGALIIANLWGFIDGEWKGNKTGRNVALAGNAVIFAALFLLC